MEQAMSNYGFLNQLANNELSSYRSHIESIDQQNNINKIVGLTGIIGNLQVIPSLLSKSLTGVRQLTNSLKILPKEESTYYSSLKNNPVELSRTGLNEQGQLTLPENRISDFSRKYYSDDEFRSNVENELNAGEGDLTRVAEEGGIRGMSAEEARLGYNYGQAYRDFGNNLRVRNPEMTPEDIDQGVSRYADRLENGLQDNMKFMRDPSIANRPNVVEGAVQRIGARVQGKPNSQYEFLDDVREQIRGDVVGNSNKSFTTQASSGERTAGGAGDGDVIQMSDLRTALEPSKSISGSAEKSATDLVEDVTGEETSVSARMGEAVSARLAEDIRVGAGSAVSRTAKPFSIQETNPELFEATTGKTAFPLLEEPEPSSLVGPAPVPAPVSATPTGTVSTASPTAVEEPVSTATAPAETEATTAGEGIGSEVGGLASEIGGAEATGVLELAGAVLNPVMLLGSVALLGYQTYQLFTKQSAPPPPAVTYGQINEGE